MIKTRCLISLVCLLIAAGCSKHAEKQLKPPGATSVQSGLVIIPPDSPKLTQIRVEPLSVKAVPSGEVTAPGKIEADPNRVSRVPLPVAGRIAQVLVKLGDSVKANQSILVIESSDADAATAAYSQSEAGLT